MRTWIEWAGIVICLIVATNLQGQIEKKSLQAVKITEEPVIDGSLNDNAWKDKPLASGFYQVEPYNGEPASLNSEVKVVYSNDAIFVGAMLFDPHPDSIYKELTERDDIKIDDYFGIYLDPFNDGQKAYGFFVTAAGVQIDMKANVNGHEDDSWDAVWQSAVKIDTNGWIVEYKIPYSALRFPKKDLQNWGMNINRNIQRYRENTSWNFVDIEKSGFINQQGELNGLKDIKPPLRLSLFPYISGYTEKHAGDKSWSYAYNYGMDLKYGINESFTLDMTLIPDFGQVQSDDQIVNFSPFEVYYQEKRPFFTEGTELFDRNNVFYSRRVGDEPDGYREVIHNNPNKEIVENPTENQLINATKLSGKTNNGLGIGIFNAMTSNTYAILKDSAGSEEKILTQPFTNYNMMVFDQALKNNSSVSFYNTNVYKGKNEKTANVSGISWQLRDKKNLFGFKGHTNVSQMYFPDNKTDLGFNITAELGKISGNLLYAYSLNLESNTYNPNDLGFLRNNNEFQHSLEVEYNIYKPFWKLLSWYNEFDIWYQSLYLPREYTQLGFNFETRATFRNYLTIGGSAGAYPVDQHDYFEPRVEGWYWAEPAYTWFNFFYSPDYRKKFILDFNFGTQTSNEYKSTEYWISLRPRIRINDKFSINHKFKIFADYNDLGYVTDSTNDGKEVIIFGKRDITNIENTLNFSYIFNNKSGLSFRLRHYWLKAVYDRFYDLQPDGKLEPNSYNDPNDFTFNAFNIDMVYTWTFAPGSELSLVWKNAIYTNSNETTENYFDNFRNTISSPATNSFSVKFMYYLDYHYLKKGFSKVFRKNS